ncbi:hypothetical protein [Salinicola sp. CPA57]|uniref:hypothetical protein n=1 Tax=Salinicola sp. CPA57 TaxID=1949080 RepID=UPI0013009A6D|nr:hypothetical protein [Salinicola sp. CPA57]
MDYITPFLLIFGITPPFIFAGVVAAVLRVLILARYPPPPRPPFLETLRQALVAFILIISINPFAIYAGVDPALIVPIAIALALSGPENSARYCVRFIKLFLPETFRQKVEDLEKRDKELTKKEKE